MSYPYVEKNDPWSSHSIIINWLRNIPPNSVILDIGTATGIIGKKSAKFGLYLKGIEPNIHWAEIASQYYDELVSFRLEDTDDEYIARADVVVLADILEHLLDPDGQLERLIKLQNHGCRLIISVPNIANIWVRLNLLMGKFDYGERGILDRTHLHFFTRDTLLNILNSKGLRILEIKTTPIPLPVVSRFFESNQIGKLIYYLLAKITSVFPTLFGYQFVVLAQK